MLWRSSKKVYRPPDFGEIQHLLPTNDNFDHDFGEVKCYAKTGIII